MYIFLTYVTFIILIASIKLVLLQVFMSYTLVISMCFQNIDIFWLFWDEINILYPEIERQKVVVHF